MVEWGCLFVDCEQREMGERSGYLKGGFYERHVEN